MVRAEIFENDMCELASRNTIPVERLHGTTVLITGANGMIAQYLAQFLMYLNRNQHMHIHVIALVRNLDKAKKLFKQYADDEHFTLLGQDVCNPIQLDMDVDYVIHAAGGASPKAIVSDPVGIIRANTLGTLNVLDYAQRYHAKGVLYLSTREIYGEVHGITELTESTTGTLDPLDTRSCYPESKRMGEQILKSYATQYGVPFWIARIAHSYGPGMSLDGDGRVMADFIADAVHSRNITMNSDGSAVRAFCYITDCIAGLLTIMLMGQCNEAYNLANETEPYMIREVAHMLSEAFPERNIGVEYKKMDKQGQYTTYERIQLDTSKLERLGWKPEVRLIDGLVRTVQSFNE